MSTSESKKKSSSKRSKKEHEDEKIADDIPVEEVHTANNWESVDLGDDQRKQKFLRLMGAKKRKDETRTDRQDSLGSNHDDDDEITSEKKHCRSKEETEQIARELEKQFNEGLQSKIAHIHHGGLGFHGDNPPSSSTNDWQHQSTKTKFVPAKTEVGSSMDHVVVDDTKIVDDKSSDKQEKKKKSKS